MKKKIMLYGLSMAVAIATPLAIVYNVPHRNIVDGLKGNDGLNGVDGKKGSQGIQGLQGIPGKDGADSTVPGPQGIKGDKGDVGPIGPQGPKGDASDGLVGYLVDIHVDAQINNSTTGTGDYSEYISLTSLNNVDLYDNFLKVPITFKGANTTLTNSGIPPLSYHEVLFSGKTTYTDHPITSNSETITYTWTIKGVR